MLVKIAERRAQLDQQLLDIQQMQLELDTAEERCKAALEKLFYNSPLKHLFRNSVIKECLPCPSRNAYAW